MSAVSAMGVIGYIIWRQSPEVFRLGSLYIDWYSLLFVTGLACAYFILRHVFRLEGVEIGLVDRLVLCLVVAGIIGGRLGEVFFYNWPYYREHPDEIFMVWRAGAAIHGSAIAIVLALLIFSRWSGLNFWWLCDGIPTAIAVIVSLLRVGNLMNSEIYGKPTTVPWAFVFPEGRERLSDGTLLNDVPCHPTQIYEAASYLAVGLIVYLIWRKRRSGTAAGRIFGIFLVSIFSVRFLIEFLKVPQEGFHNATCLNMGQWLSIPFIVLGVFCILMRSSWACDAGRWSQS